MSERVVGVGRTTRRAVIHPVVPRWDTLRPFGGALLAVAATSLVVGVLQAVLVDFQAAILLYLVPIILAASRWGRGPAICAVVASVLVHDVLLVEPRGTFSIARADEALGLVLLLFTALVTAQLADGARRGAERAREAAVARRSEEMKTALLRAVTHNLRTPLASIKASVSGLRQPGTLYSEEDRAELLAEIEEEADHLDRLVTNLLDASRIEAGSLRPSCHPQDLGELVHTSAARLSVLLADHPLTIDIPDTLPAAWCDYAQIDQVVTNLLENAARHTPPGTPIRVVAAPAGNMLRVEVSDQGPGIPSPDRERLFQPFERGHTRASGTGLGLTIARGFVQAHGGQLWLADGQHAGARFTFTLPCAVEAVP